MSTKTIIVGTSLTRNCAYRALRQHGANVMQTQDREDQSATEESLLKSLCDWTAPASVVVATTEPVLEGKKRVYKCVFLYGVVLSQTSA